MFDKIKSLLTGTDKNSIKANSKYKILVVEDGEVDRKLIVSVLAKNGFQVVTANDGQQGLDVAQSEKPNLIIADCEMPVMDGIEMCRQLKETEGTQHIPVVFLTGLDTPRNVIDCFETDAENYLNKPIKPKILLEEIQQVFQDKTTIE